MRGLLVAGNQKLAESVFHFDLPAVVTCPGASNECKGCCYALRRRFRFKQVKDRLRWSLEQAKQPDFVDRMIGEIRAKGVLAMRWHVSGDFFSPSYARKILEVVSQSRHTRFWLYTRSWRIPQIARVLRKLAKLPNVAVWYSADKETGMPRKPPRVRVAWMMTKEGEKIPRGVDLIFLDRPLRRRVDLPILADVCPQEQAGGEHVTCAHCQICFPE